MMLWMMRKKVRRWPAFLAYAVVTLIAGVVLVGAVALSYAAGYTKGSLKTYASGVSDGYALACVNVQIQTQWTLNVENGLVVSKHHTPAISNLIRDAANGTRHFVCNRTVASGPNLYDPSASTPLVALSAAPTTHIPFNSRILLQGVPKKKPVKKHGGHND